MCGGGVAERVLLSFIYLNKMRVVSIRTMITKAVVMKNIGWVEGGGGGEELERKRERDRESERERERGEKYKRHRQTCRQTTG